MNMDVEEEHLSENILIHKKKKAKAIIDSDSDSEVDGKSNEKPLMKAVINDSGCENELNEKCDNKMETSDTEAADSGISLDQHDESLCKSAVKTKAQRQRAAFQDSSDEESDDIVEKKTDDVIEKKLNENQSPLEQNTEEKLNDNRQSSERNKTRKDKMAELLAKVKAKKSEKEAKEAMNEKEKKENNDVNIKNKDFEESAKNKYLYSQDSSDDDEKESIDNEKENKGNEDESKEKSQTEDEEKHQKSKTPNKKKTQKAPKRAKKSEVQEMKSEQQRLCREQTFKIPAHVPQARPIQDFLKRVPNLKKKLGTTPPPPSTPYQQLIQNKPKLKLSMPNDVIEFSINNDNEDVTPQAVNTSTHAAKKSSAVLDGFMQRFAKHTNSPKPVAEQTEAPTVITSQTPGKGITLLKSQLKKQIRDRRYQSHLEMEAEMKQMREEDEEEEYVEDETEDLSSEDEDFDPKQAVKNLSEDEDDDEIDKWNMEDEQKQVEDLMNEMEEKQQDTEPQIADLTNQWDDTSSSSILPAGQGEPTGLPSACGRITPGTKLLKSSMLDSTSKASESDAIKHDNDVLILPSEDTQDLYKTNEPSTACEEDEETQAPLNFSLGGDTQFESILDSQGLLQTKPKFSKKLFEPKEDSMSEVLGLCSGKFSKPSAATDTQAEEISSTVLGLCSGRFPSEGKEASWEGFGNKTADDESGKSQEEKKPVALSIFGSQTTKDDEGIDSQLLGLCSGRFFSQVAAPVHGGMLDGSDDAVDFSVEMAKSSQEIEESKESTKSIEPKDDEHDEAAEEDEVEDESEEGNMGDDKEGDVEDVEDVADEELVEDGEELLEESEPEELLEWKNSLKEQGTKKLNKRAFYEDEAVLSGSEASEDEEYGSEVDEYEHESDDETLPTGEKLKRQVHKIHQRKVLNQDQHEIRLLQELYLEDGDLGGGTKRKRNFRWKNVDSTFEAGAQANQNLDDEETLNMAEGDVEKRIERLEKEQFVKNMQETEPLSEFDENSQSILNMIQVSSQKVSSQHSERSNSQSTISSNIPRKPSGSFLSRGKALTRLAQTVAEKKGGKSAGKCFVFNTDENKVENKVKKNDKEAPPSKRTKIERTLDKNKNSKSIFSHL